MFKALLYSLYLILFSWSSAIALDKTAHDFNFKDIDGNIIDFADYKGKVILVVNVASKCGFSNQYTDLQAIWDKYKNDNFILIGVPSNDFYQELDSEEEVKNFCELTFGVNFPMTSITSVRGKNAHPFYKWAQSTYGSKAVPKWNFHKILIDKNGLIVDTYSSTTKPTDKRVIKKIENLL